MPVPVISPVRSLLYYAQWQTWARQPFATETPTSWAAASALPPGLSLNATTGLLSGAVTMPGVYEFALTATNASGTSAPGLFVAGITPTTWTAPVDALDVILDLGTGLVTVNDLTSTPGGTLDQQTVLAWLKSGDARLLHIRPVKNGAVCDIAFLTLKLAAKVFEPEASVIASTAFGRAATGPDTYYRMAVLLTDAQLDAELFNAENEAGTLLTALFEFEWTWTNTLTPDCGLTTVRGSSQNFALGVERQMIANA